VDTPILEGRVWKGHTQLDKKKCHFFFKTNGPTNIGIVVFGNGGGLYPPLEKIVPFPKHYSLKITVKIK
jgi:hypothetical protein